MVYDPEEAGIFSQIANMSVLFSVRSKTSTFLIGISGLISFSLYAYRLLPCCLRLTPYVAIWCPRLAMSGLLDLAQWDSRPLYGTPFSWRTGRPLTSFLEFDFYSFSAFTLCFKVRTALEAKDTGYNGCGNFCYTYIVLHRCIIIKLS